jgi:DNA-binding NtrC family response regulator
LTTVPTPLNPILVVDDEYYILLNLSAVLKSHGFDNVMTCQDGRQVMTILEEREIELLLLDLTMPHVSGMDLLPRIRERYPDVPVVVVTGAADIATAVECMKLGVSDYLVKSVEEGKLVATVSRAVEIRELKRENRALRDHLVGQKIENPDAVKSIVHTDPRMRALLMYVESIARGKQTVLVTGETGAGKDLVARAIHDLSGRGGEYVAVNVAGLDDAMFGDTLFGHTRGAYTGAAADRRGLVAAASGGTLFLDEIGDLPPRSQVSLLRLLETREYYPLGSDLARRTDARIVVATNRDLPRAMRDGAFRRDLYYRLQTHHVRVPPLRERPDDLPVLVPHFLAEASAEYGKPGVDTPAGLVSLLRRRRLPGNVRELRSLLFDAVSRMVGPTLDLGAVERAIADRPEEEADADGPAIEIRGAFPTLRQASDHLVQEALRRTGGNQARAAALLGVSAPALSRRLRRAPADDTDEGEAESG